MTPQEFTVWLKGFTAAAHSYNVTPAQWETIKEKLAQVHVDAPTLNYWKHTTTTAESFNDNNKQLLND
jgi:hypothetical protein